jgi:UPF0755 protein
MRWPKVVAILLLLIVLAIVGLFVVSIGAKDANSDVKKDFVIEPGSSSSSIAERLTNEGLIRNSFGFYVYLKITRSTILPGTYELSPAQSATSIANSITSGKFKVAKVTIIEGWRVSQIADYLINDKKLKNVADFADVAKQDEGYLFPDTYEVKVDISSKDLVDLMRKNFEDRTKDLKITPETVILASIVEREAQSDADRSPIAGVYANRIKIGMMLQADPTIQYAKGNWEAVTLSEYQTIDSPYNTYLHDGWPPGPICNPGLASLKAAASPEKNDYLFFFHAKGQTYFSKTAAEHQAKVAKYF